MAARLFPKKVCDLGGRPPFICHFRAGARRMLSNLLVSQPDIGAAAAPHGSFVPFAAVPAESWVFAAVGGLVALFAFGVYTLIHGDELDRFR